jgi:hypothetical protein
LPGLYRVRHLPYAVAPMIGAGSLRPQCLAWLGFLEKVHTHEYPCGHLCTACQQRILADLDTHTTQMAWAALR